jgi:hypothetical protein
VIRERRIVRARYSVDEIIEHTVLLTGPRQKDVDGHERRGGLCQCG